MIKSLSVLIVEDEPLIAMMLEDFVDTLGHQVAGSCESVGEALAKVGESRFDAAILDVNLRGGEASWPVADALADKGIPYIVATGGHVSPPPSRHAAAPQLAKPYGMDDVRVALEALAAG